MHLRAARWVRRGLGRELVLDGRLPEVSQVELLPGLAFVRLGGFLRAGRRRDEREDKRRHEEARPTHGSIVDGPRPERQERLLQGDEDLGRLQLADYLVSDADS